MLHAFNYDDALDKTLLFFEAQRSGKLPPTQRVKWRGDSGIHDGYTQGVCTSDLPPSWFFTRTNDLECAFFFNYFMHE